MSYIMNSFRQYPCVFLHDNISMLFGVPEQPIEQLPKICVCGAASTYAEEVAFVSAPTLEEQKGVINETIELADKHGADLAVVLRDPGIDPNRNYYLVERPLDVIVLSINLEDEPPESVLPSLLTEYVPPKEPFIHPDEIAHAKRKIFAALNLPLKDFELPTDPVKLKTLEEAVSQILEEVRAAGKKKE
jgi:hypothetical protein